MSKAWYPVIDYEKCTMCGSCVNKCTNGVYDKKQAPKPVVIYPQGCIQGCHGCGNICPAKAITYYGDKNGNQSSGSGCKCGGKC